MNPADDPKYQVLSKNVKSLKKNMKGYDPQRGEDFFTNKDIEDISERIIEKTAKNIEIVNDVTGFVEKVISKINIQNNPDLTPLLKSLEKIHTKLCDTTTAETDEIDYTKILNEIKGAIPQVRENPLIQDISDTLNDFIIRFDKLLTENNRLRVEVDRVGGGGGGGGVLPKGVLNASDVRINPATEETLAGQFATQLDDVSTTGVTYVGKATIGSSASSAVWQIKKIDETGTPITMVITWADGNATFDNVWDNRASLSYS